jgi:hypothetical protein
MPQSQDYPSYLDAIELGEERSIRARIDELRIELQGLNKALDHARRAKRILWVAGKELEGEVMRFLSDLRLQTRPFEGDGDGFWVADGANRDWCIGEVRGTNGGNVTKQQIAELMVRRARAGKDEGAPALLVANTFDQAQSLEERDQPVPADVARRAVEDHVLVMRTMDLFRLQQRAATGLPTAEVLTEALRGRGGWLEVDPSLNIKVHGAEEAASSSRPEMTPTPFFDRMPEPQQSEVAH